MKTIVKCGLQILCLGLIAITIACNLQTKRQINSAEFITPPDNAKIHTWWHWMDGNITKEGITKDLEAMKEQGIVQATILNVGLFGERDFGVKKVNFNSPEWFEMFQWALQEGDRLGILIGAHNCDGWSTSGGPWITPEMSMKEYTFTKTIVNSSQDEIKLMQPLANRNFYKDVTVVAIRSDQKQNSFVRAAPAVAINEIENAHCIFDGCPSSALTISQGDRLTFYFKETFEAEKIQIMPRRAFMWSNPADFTSTYSISVSDDGKNFKKIKDFTITGVNKMESVPFAKTSSKYFRLTLIETNNLDGWIPLTIAECELLSEDETPLYTSEIEYLSEKAGSAKAGNELVFYGHNNTNGNDKVKEVIDLTSKMSSDGTLNWKPEEGSWAIIRFGYTTTGAVNSPATAAGIGLECDKMDTAALNLHFKSFPAKLIEKAGSYAGNTFKFMLIDSWECGYQNWTAAMMKEFEQRRGYSLASYIPVLCGESSGVSEIDEAVLYDFRKTIGELVENNYYKHFGALLHKYKIEFHAEVIYGNANYPALDILKTTQYVDLPMYEFWSSTDDKRIVTYYPASGIELNMPSCAAIGYEKPVMASEAYTGSAHYSETPSGLKPFGDRAYCAGINQMILHSYVHQPNDTQPGMTLGPFASHFNRNNSYWPHISEWLNYQSRIQSVLQQGVASHDVLYFLGDQLPQYLTYNKSNKLPFGYMLNSCNYDILNNRINVTKGKLVLNGKAAYSVLSLPPFESLSFETLNRIGELVNEGAVVYGSKPLRMLSLNDIKTHKTAFNKLAGEIWGKIDGHTVTSNKYGKGKVYWGISLAEVLKSENVLPDVNTRENDTTNLMFIHKKIEDCDVYFVMNQQNLELRREMSFRVTGKTPEIWDPEYGSITKPAVYITDENYTTLPVSLKPYQSLLFIFKNEKPVNYIQNISHGGIQIFPAEDHELQTVPVIVEENNSFVAISHIDSEYELMSNQQKKFILKPTLHEVFIISVDTGTITFDPGYHSSLMPVALTGLQWLTESKDQNIKYFSGNVKYVIPFQFPVDKIKASDSVLLDLGEFEAIARVKLNGVSLGIIWNPEMYLSVKGILQTDNHLEISVVNTFRNRFIGDFVQYGKVQNLWTSSPISDYLNAESTLDPSGLKGPIRIISIKKVALK